MAAHQDVFRAAMEVDLVFEAEDVVVEEEVVFRIVRRNLRDVLNPFELPEIAFKDIFRLSKDTTRYIVDVLEPNLRATARSTAIPPFLRVSVIIILFSS